jgi:hypothetical protein
MRAIGPALIVVMFLGLASAPPAFAQRNLPSDVEERMGIPPNAANPDGRRGRYRGRPLPSDVEQRMRRRAYRNDYYDERRPRHRPAYGYGYYR